MKKLISLLLAIVMCCGLLTGIALADDPVTTEPVECSQGEALLKVTSSDDANAAYYFDVLDQNVLAWICLNVPGEKTVTLLKDVELTGAIEGFNYLLKIPNDQSSWAGRNGTKFPLVLDLNGKVMTYTGSSILFYLERYGFTVKNGTIIYKSDSADNAVFALSAPHFRTAFTNGSTVWTPAFNLTNVRVYNITGQNGPVVLNYEYAPVISVKDSVLWTYGGNTFDMKKTDQTKMNDDAAVYEGDYLPTIGIEYSVIGSANDVPFAATDAGTIVEIADSTLVSGAASGAIVNDETKIEIDTKGYDAEIKDGWTKAAPTGALKGKAYLYGDAVPAEAPLPFEDVKEADWFYSFVKEMYEAKVINGMTDTTFVPAGTLTYGQALKLITVGIGWGEQAAGDHWASGYLAMAKAKGWLEGDVDLNAPISRLQFCQIAAKAKGLTEAGENPFKDTADASVLALVKAGVISGMSADTFAPDQTLTRAQIAKIIALLSKI